MISRSFDGRRAALAGAFAGLTAGVLLTMFMTVMSASAGKDIWYGIKGAAAPFLGERAMQPGFDLGAAALGLVCHLGISAAWGALFGLLVYTLRPALVMAASVAWGFVVWLGMYYAVLPLVGLASMQHDAPVGRAIAFHLIFSVATGAALLLYRRLTSRTPPRARTRRHTPDYGLRAARAHR